MFRVTPTTPEGPRLVEGKGVVQPGPVESEAIERFWNDHLSSHPDAFDGEMISVVSIGANRAELIRTGFRYWLAQRAGVAQLGIRPLGVTGLLRIEGKWLCARRSARVTQDAGLWEFAPSGSVSGEARGADGTLDARRQLAIEAAEELNLPAQVLERPAAVAFVEDTDTGVCDLLFHADLELSAREFDRLWAARANREYVACVLLDPASVRVPGIELSPFARFCAREILPTLA